MVAVGGGGAKNAFLMSILEKEFTPVPVRTVRSFGIDEDFKEAIGFALLANETIRHRASNVPQTTGASRPAILGKYCPV